MFITCKRILLPLANGLNERATQMCAGLRINGSTRPLVTFQGALSFPVMNCLDRPGIEMLDRALIVKLLVMLLASLRRLVDGTYCCMPWIKGIVY